MSMQLPNGWRDAFLAALAKDRCVVKACRAAGVGRATAYRHRETNPDFATRWDEVVADNVDELEGSVMSRAIDGWLEPVYVGGKMIGATRKYDNTLAWRLLAARKRAIYGAQVATNETADVLAQKIRDAQAHRDMLDDMERNEDGEEPEQPPA